MINNVFDYSNKNSKRRVEKNIKNKIVDNELEINDVNENSISLLKKEIKINITDPRQKSKIIYKIWDVVITVFLAVLANCNDWDDIVIFAKENYAFLRKHLKMTGGIPTAITYERIISIIDKKELENICVYFLTDIIKIKRKKARDILSIDGKTDNGSSRTCIDKETNEIKNIKSLNVLNAYSNQLGICVASEMIEEKTNEITAFPDIINRLNIRNKIITVDAINTQTANCKLVIEKRGDYVMALKGNQNNFYKDVVDYFDEKHLKELKQYKENYLKITETRGNEIITYEYFQTNDVKWYHDFKSWKGLKTIGMVRKKFNNPYKEKKTECRYYISSLDVNIDLFQNAIKSHWSVENILHGHLDLTFKQDDNSTVNKEALFGLQLIKKMVLSTLKPISKEEKISMNKLRLTISFNIEKGIDKIHKFYAKKGVKKGA